MDQTPHFDTAKQISDQSTFTDEKASTNHKKKKAYVIIIIGLITIFIIAAAYVYVVVSKRKSEKSSRPSVSNSLLTNQQTLTTNTNTINLSVIPSLPNQFTWNKSSIDEADNTYNQVYVINEPDIFYKPVSLPGTVWISNLKNIQSDDFNPHEDLFEYFSTGLTNLNWDSDVESETYRLVANDADGGLGSSTGYIGLSNHQLRVVNVGYLVTSLNELTLIRDAQYWVFISDTVSVLDIVRQAEDIETINNLGNQQSTE